MAKKHKLSSNWQVKAGVLMLEISANETEGEKAFVGKFERSINCAETFGAGYTSLNAVGQAALDFGAFTALRNATGSAETLDEAAQAIDRRVEAWAGGNWGSEREQSATPFSAAHILSLAVERASKGAQTAAEAAEKLCEMAESTCAANNLAAFASLEPADRAKIRKAIVDQVRENKPAINVAYLAIENEREQARLDKRRAEAAKAESEVDDDEGALL